MVGVAHEVDTTVGLPTRVLPIQLCAGANTVTLTTSKSVSVCVRMRVEQTGGGGGTTVVRTTTGVDVAGTTVVV